MTIPRYAGAACAALLLLVAGPRVATAQYFGQNHVQYQTFDFRILRTAHFDVYFYDQEQDAAVTAARIAERWHTRLAEILQDSLGGRQPLILYASPAHFRQTNTVAGVGEGTGGVTESFKRRIVLPFGVSLDESDHVIGHELVHAFQYDIAGRSPGGIGSTATLPLWFIEGMAEYLSIGPVDAHTAMWLRDAVQRNDLPSISNLDDPQYFPYRYGQAFWAFVAGKYGDEVVGNLLRVATRVRDPMMAIATTLKVDPDSLSAEWHAAIRAAYASPPPDLAPRVLVAQSTGAEPAMALFTRQKSGGRLNVGPSLSPDGTRIVFLSERNRLAVDLYLADATTGRIIKTVTKTAVDPHLESLQFIYSAGAWHPDNQRFAVATTVRGRPALTIYNLTGGGEQEVRLDDLDEIFNPSWAPDGNKVVFTAQVGGLTDLYVYDFTGGGLQRLTNDSYTNLEPAWSPDGRRIAFVTDRTTDTTNLSYGSYRVVLLDVASGQLTPLPPLGPGKQINPQWSSDGRSLFLLADPDGVTNVYRFDFADSRYYKLTDLYTGVSGITALSPALTVGGDRMAISVYRDGGAEIHRLEASLTGGEPAGPPSTSYARTATLPPGERVPSAVTQYLADARTGLPSADQFGVDRYRPSFGLDYIAQTNVGVSTSRFGTFASGGAALYWSSMLGERQLVTMLQINGTLKDIAAGVGYANLNRRVDWSVQLSQIPYTIRGFSSGIDQGSGDYVQQEITQRQTNRQLAVSLQYPFSRAQRFELQAGGRQISFDGEFREDHFDPNTGQYLGRVEGNFPLGEDLWLGEGLTALVFDNSIFGGTGPIMGSRWRLEAAPTFGSLNYVGALVDIRKYFNFSRPLSIGTRVMHYARYGSGGEDPRLQPLFIGYPSMVHGYDDGSFSARECNQSATATDSCPVYNQLLGSRVLVGNVELRFQLLGPFGVTGRAFLPIDFIAFADAGVAWDSSEEPRLFGGTRPGVSSVGGGVRINLFGFMIGELVMVRPMDRPDKGWYFQFGFNPGF